MTFEQFVIVEVHNGGIGVERFESNKLITLEVLVDYFETNRELDWHTDTITLIDPPVPITLG